MTTFISILMADHDGPSLELKDLLLLIPDNALVWSILHFYGVGIPPGNLTMDQFELLVRSRPTGYLMSWAELKDFASGLEQTFDCLVVAAPTAEGFALDRANKENFMTCNYVIEGFDGIEWSVWAKDQRVRQVFSNVFTVE